MKEAFRMRKSSVVCFNYMLTKESIYDSLMFNFISWRWKLHPPNRASDLRFPLPRQFWLSHWRVDEHERKTLPLTLQRLLLYKLVFLSISLTTTTRWNEFILLDLIYTSRTSTCKVWEAWERMSAKQSYGESRPCAFIPFPHRWTKNIKMCKIDWKRRRKWS